MKPMTILKWSSCSSVLGTIRDLQYHLRWTRSKLGTFLFINANVRKPWKPIIRTAGTVRSYDGDGKMMLSKPSSIARYNKIL